jgi:hypothetical protein
MFTPMSSAAGWSSLVSLEERVRRLEQALTLSVSALQTLAVALKDKLGPEALGEEMQRWAAADDDAEMRAVFASIDDLIREGQQPAAVRRYRELYGVTWDQALDAIRVWDVNTSEQKMRALRLTWFIKVLTTPRA